MSKDLLSKIDQDHLGERLNKYTRKALRAHNSWIAVIPMLLDWTCG